jgi:hypothetical protein
MIKILIILFPILLICISCKQTEIEYYEDGSVKLEYTLKEGKIDGELTYFSPEGAILKKLRYSEGQLNGDCYHFYENGDIKVIERYSNGALEGLTEWFYQNGSFESKHLFSQGQLNGESVWFYENGSKKTVKYFNSDTLLGMMKFDSLTGVMTHSYQRVWYSPSEVNAKLGDTINFNVKYFKIPEKQYDSLRLMVYNLSQEESVFDTFVDPDKAISFVIVPSGYGDYMINLTAYDPNSRIFLGLGSPLYFEIMRDSL